MKLYKSIHGEKMRMIDWTDMKWFLSAKAADCYASGYGGNIYEQKNGLFYNENIGAYNQTKKDINAFFEELYDEIFEEDEEA